MSDDHVDPGALRELPYLDFLNDAVMGDELQAQIRRLRASTTLAYRVPLDELDLRVEAFEHAQAQSHERIGFDGLALAIEQQRIAFNLGELEFAIDGGEDRFEQLVDDVRAVDELCRGQEFRVAADVRYQDRRTLGHRCPPNSLAVSPRGSIVVVRVGDPTKFELVRMPFSPPQDERSGPVTRENCAAGPALHYLLD